MLIIDIYQNQIRIKSLHLAQGITCRCISGAHFKSSQITDDTGKAFHHHFIFFNQDSSVSQDASPP